MDGSGPGSAEGRFRLRILATTDLHAHVLAWDYNTDQPAADRGLTRLARLVARLRRGADATLLVDNGDFLQGSPLGDAAAEGALAGLGPHPVIAMMNRLGYDAAALGNHEFSHGLPFLLESLGQAHFPVLSATILTQKGAEPAEDRHLLPPAVLIHRSPARGGRLTLGLIGLTPTQTLSWEASRLDRPLFARDLVQAAQHQAQALRARGADLVIALCHAGIAFPGEPAHPEAHANAVAALPGIDALVSGHSHRSFPLPGLAPGPDFDPARGRLFGKPAVAPGVFGSHLGLIDFVLRPEGAGWKIGRTRSRLLAVAARSSQSGRLRPLVREAAELRAAAWPAHLATRQWAARVVGHNPADVSSHFSLVFPGETERLVARAQIAALRREWAGGAAAQLPILAAATPYRAGGRGGPDNYTILPRGPLTLRHLAELYPHPNALVALRLTGQELAEWLERAAALYLTLAQGRPDQPLIDPAFPIFNFDMVEGVSYEIDLSQPARYDQAGQLVRPQARRIRDLRLDGQALAPTAEVILATNTYRLSGAGGFALGLQDRCLPLRPIQCRDAVQDYIQAAGWLPPPDVPNWRLAPLADASAVIELHPEAERFLPPGGRAWVEALDQLPNGFRRFRLHLDRVMTPA